MSNQKNISIFTYTDYRSYLSDYYEHKKKLNHSFSYRSFALKAGYNSSGLYKDIVNGRTNISTGLIAKFSRAIGHNKREEEYFENMVLFNQAKNTEDKDKYFKRMMRNYNSKAYLVNSKQYEFYSKWYYSAVRELLDTGDFSDDYTAIANSLNPKIRADQAKKAIKILNDLGLIKENQEGYYKVVNELITTGENVNSLNVRKFQKEMMDLAKEAIDRHPNTQRNISTASISISEGSYQEIVSELISVRKRIMDIAKNDEHTDRVYQVNIQLFPLTKIKDNKK